MADEAIDSEVSRVAIEIFPLGAGAVTTVLEHLPQPLTYGVMGEYVRAEIPMHEAENPYAIGYLMSFASNLPENEGLEFQLGVTLGRQFLKQRAGERGLQKLTQEFIKGYDQTRLQRLLTAYGSLLESPISVEIKEEEIQKGLFPKLEPDAYQALEQGMAQRGYSLSSSAIFSGIAASYFLFREGLNNPSYHGQQLRWQLVRGELPTPKTKLIKPS
jgi:hypothetical protein